MNRKIIDALIIIYIALSAFVSLSVYSLLTTILPSQSAIISVLSHANDSQVAAAIIVAYREAVVFSILFVADLAVTIVLFILILRLLKIC